MGIEKEEKIRKKFKLHNLWVAELSHTFNNICFNGTSASVHALCLIEMLNLFVTWDSACRKLSYKLAINKRWRVKFHSDKLTYNESVTSHKQYKLMVFVWELSNKLREFGWIYNHKICVLKNLMISEPQSTIEIC